MLLNQQHFFFFFLNNLMWLEKHPHFLTVYFATQFSGTSQTLHPLPLGLNIIGGKMEDVLGLLHVFVRMCVFYVPE